jgi:hypothetical protein
MKIQEQAIEEREQAAAFAVEEAEATAPSLAEDVAEGERIERTYGISPNGPSWRGQHGPSRPWPEVAEVILPPYKKNEPYVLTVERQRRGEMMPR